MLASEADGRLTPGARSVTVPAPAVHSAGEDVANLRWIPLRRALGVSGPCWHDCCFTWESSPRRNGMARIDFERLSAHPADAAPAARAPEPECITLLDLVTAVAEYASSDAEVISAVLHLIES